MTDYVFIDSLCMQGDIGGDATDGTALAENALLRAVKCVA